MRTKRNDGFDSHQLRARRETTAGMSEYINSLLFIKILIPLLIIRKIQASRRRRRQDKEQRDLTRSRKSQMKYLPRLICAEQQISGRQGVGVVSC
jgi:hypothetical protein